MKKEQKNLMDRRQFIQNTLMGTGLGLSSPMQVFLMSLFSGMMNKAYAQSAGINSDMNFINFSIPGGPPRWMFDLPLRPNGTSDPLVANSMVGSKFDANLNMVYTNVTHSNFNGIQMPYMWGGSIPTVSGSTLMANLAPNLLMIRGMSMQIDSHEVDLKKQVLVTPDYSLTGLAADAASTPLPAISYVNRDSNFVSKKGMSSVNTFGTSPILDVLSPFNNSSSLTEISNAQVDTAINNLLNLMKTKAADKHQYLPSSFTDRQNAKALMKTAFGDLQAEYTTLRNKYKTLIQRSISESALFLAEVEGLNVPGSSTQDKFKFQMSGTNYRYTGPNLNACFNSTTTIDYLAESMAVTEYMITKRYSTSICCDIGAMKDILIDTAAKFDGSGNSSNFVTSLHTDAHDIGAVLTLIGYTKFYRAVAACMYELIQKLKAVTASDGKNLFQKSVIALNAEFNRCGKTDASGSDHGWWGTNYSIFSGMITQCEVVGNVTAETGYYAGTWGKASPVSYNNSRELLISNVGSTVATMLNQPSPTPNDISLVGKNQSTGVVTISVPRGINV
jgi:hypothetical protein